MQKVCISTGQNRDRKVSDPHLLVYAQCMQWISVSLSTKIFSKNVAFLSFCGCFDKKMVSNNLVFHCNTVFVGKRTGFSTCFYSFFFRRLKKSAVLSTWIADLFLNRVKTGSGLKIFKFKSVCDLRWAETLKNIQNRFTYIT